MLLGYVVHAYYYLKEPLKVHERLQMHWFVAALTTAVPYLTTQINANRQQRILTSLPDAEIGINH